MKKLTLFASSLLTLCALSGCNGNGHTHEYVEVSAVAATCTTGGNALYYTCATCDKIFNSEKKETTLESVTIDALGHELASAWTVDPDNHYHKCSREGCNYKGDIAAHHYVESSKTDATCENDGVRHLSCDVCGATSDETINKLGHSWDAGEVTTPATCEADGVKTFHCTRTGCSETKNEPIDALGHDWDYDNVTPGVAATCTTSGTNIIHCKRTGCTKTETETVSALGHRTDSTWHFTEAKHWHECLRDGCEDHVDEASHTKKSTYSVDETHHWHDCEAECGVKLDYEEHSVSSWETVIPATEQSTGTEKGNCTGCNKEITRTTPKLAPTPEEMIAKIAALDTNPVAAQTNIVKALKERYDLMEESKQAEVTNKDKLLSHLANQTNNVSIVTPYEFTETEASANYVTSIEDNDYFGKVYQMSKDTATDYSKIKVALDPEKLLHAEAISIWVKGYTGDSLIMLDDFDKATQAEKFAFFKQKDSNSTLEHWDNTLGKPSEDGWTQYCGYLNANYDLVEKIKEVGYFAFKFNAGTSATMQISGLYGINGCGGQTATETIIRKTTNGYQSESGITKWNGQSQDAFYMSDKWTDPSLHYIYQNASGDVSNMSLINQSSPLTTGEATNATVMKQYFYISEPLSMQYRAGSVYGALVSYQKGWNCFVLSADMVAALNTATNVNTVLYFKNAPANTIIVISQMIGC